MLTTAAQAQRIIFWQLLALIPVVVFLVIGFTIVITRPIRQIDHAIRPSLTYHLDYHPLCGKFYHQTSRRAWL